MGSIGRQAFDRGDRSIYRRDLRLASPSCLAANLYSAGTALADAASELRSLHVENVSKYPEEGHVWRCIYRLGLPVYGQFVGHITNLLEKRIERRFGGLAYRAHRKSFKQEEVITQTLQFPIFPISPRQQCLFGARLTACNTMGPAHRCSS